MLAKDNDFQDVLIAHLCMQSCTEANTSTKAIFELTRDVLVKQGLGSRLAASRADIAVREMGKYTFDKLLYREVFDPQTKTFASKAVVPSGGLRSFRYNGRRYRLSMRKSLLLLYHDGEAAGAHTSEESTTAKLQSMFWWPGLSDDVAKWVASCPTCRLVRPQKGLTAEQRMELFDRPFKVLFIDALGPIQPAGPLDEVYILHAECPFTHWLWLKAVTHDNEDSWSKFLVEDVFFDTCGFPQVLRSDRGPAFVNKTIAAVNALLGITHAFGSSYHPQSQGVVEGRHPQINRVLASYCQSFPQSWPQWLKLAQWSMRSQPRSDRGNKSAYEMVCGLLPQGPIDALFRKTDSAKVIDPVAYVAGLQAHLSSIHGVISTQLAATHDKKIAKQERSSFVPMQPGDFVFLDVPPRAVARHIGTVDGISDRLLARRKPILYKILKRPSPQTAVLCDPNTESTSLGFAQPVHISRLVTHNLCDLEAEVSSEPLRLRIFRNGANRDASIVSQLATGAVRIQFDGPEGDIEICELEHEEYDWLV
jgi:hypothetical protein